MSPSLIEFLKHIRDEIDFMIKHSEGLTYDLLIEDEILWNILEDDVPFAKIWIDKIIETEISKQQSNNE